MRNTPTRCTPMKRTSTRCTLTGTRPSKPRPLPLRKDRSNIALSVRAKAGRYGASYALGHYDTSFFGFTFFIASTCSCTFSAIGMISSMTEEVSDPSVKVSQCLCYTMNFPSAGKATNQPLLLVCALSSKSAPSSGPVGDLRLRSHCHPSLSLLSSSPLAFPRAVSHLQGLHKSAIAPSWLV
jgi:hypothetical protein